MEEKNINQLEHIKILVSSVLKELFQEYRMYLSYEVLTKEEFLFNDIRHGRVYETLNDTTQDKIKQNIILNLELWLKSIIFETEYGSYVEKSKINGISTDETIQILYNQSYINNYALFVYQILYTIYHEFYHHLVSHKIFQNKDIKLIFEIEKLLINHGSIVVDINYSKIMSELAANSFASIKCHEYLTKNKIETNYRYVQNQIEEDKLNLANFDITSLFEFLTPKLMIRAINSGNCNYYDSTLSIFFNEHCEYHTPETMLEQAKIRGISNSIIYSMLTSKNYMNFIFLNKINLSQESFQILIEAIDSLIIEYQQKQKYNQEHCYSYIPTKKEQELISHNQKRIEELVKYRNKIIKYLISPKTKKKKKNIE